jgi:SAM-dependent methyltransferase
METTEPGNQVIEAQLGSAMLAPEFIRAILTAPQRNDRWRRAVVRAVTIGGRRQLQFTTSGTADAISANVSPEDAGPELERLLALGFRNVVIHTQSTTTTIRVGKRKTRIHTEEHSTWHPALQHDREARGLLEPARDQGFLSALGILTLDGRIRQADQAKFRQVNEFLRVVNDTVGPSIGPGQTLSVVDFGCGSAHLTFGLYYYLHVLKDCEVTLVGVDRNQRLVDKSAQLASTLGWQGVRFVREEIESFTGIPRPDLVVSLHACDTATDDALARAIGWDARWIFSVPCCHRHLQTQMKAAAAPEAYRGVVRQGILRQRLGDLLTDTFRALLLEMHGYRADVLEFIDPLYTSKNLLIRATRSPGVPSPTAQYEALKREWSVVPYLENLLQKSSSPLAGEGGPI